MNNAPLLQGYGVRMEPLSLDHIPALEQIATEPSLWRYMSIRVETAADVRTMVEDALRQADTGTAQPWVTVVGGSSSEAGQLVGSSRLFDLDLRNRTGEIGFTWLSPAYRGAGVNPRAKLLQLTYAFEQLKLRRVALKTLHENLQSQNAMRKLGAKLEGTFRNHIIMPDGTSRHSVWFSIIEEEWPAVKASLLDRIAREPLSVRQKA